MSRAYEEVIQFIARGTTADGVIAWQPSDAAKNRVAQLIANGKTGSLSPEDQDELDHYLELEHIMRMAKIYARRAAQGQVP